MLMLPSIRHHSFSTGEMKEDLMNLSMVGQYFQCLFATMLWTVFVKLKNGSCYGCWSISTLLFNVGGFICYARKGVVS